MMVYLVTSGDGSDGNEWVLHGVYTTIELANKTLEEYDTCTRRDGTTYSRGCTIETWETDIPCV